MKPGWAYAGKQRNKRPFERWEEITSGPKKGMVKIWLSNKTAIIPKEDVKIWPVDSQDAPQSTNLNKETTNAP